MKNNCKKCKCSNVCNIWNDFLESLLELLRGEDYKEAHHYIGEKFANNCPSYIVREDK